MYLVPAQTSEMMNFRLLKKLEKAQHICEPCGAEFGDSSGKPYVLQKGTCDVCGDHTLVSDTSNWGHLRRGRLKTVRRITDKINDGAQD